MAADVGYTDDFQSALLFKLRCDVAYGCRG